MRILFFSHYGSLYGANRSLLALLIQLKKKNIDLHVIARVTGSFVDQLDKHCIPYTVIYFQDSVHCSKKKQDKSPFNKKNNVLKLLRNIKIFPRIYRVVQTFHPDVIHSNSSVINIGFWTSSLFRIPHVWHVREFMDLDYNLIPDFGFAIFNRQLNHSESVIYVSESLAEHFNHAGKRAEVIYNGVLSNGETTIVKKKGTKTFRLGIIGLINKNKGHFEVVDALAGIREQLDRHNIQLNIFGQGDEEALTEYAQQNGVNSYLCFKGFYDSILDIYKECDGVIVASRNEAMGRVTAEAMLTGTPVIGYDNAGTGELIEHGKTGLLYQTSEELGSHIIQLASDEGLRKTLTEQALDFGKQHFTTEVYAEKVLDVFEDVIE